MYLSCSVGDPHIAPTPPSSQAQARSHTRSAVGMEEDYSEK